ncbi:MAG: RluA family pseudouridine synthase [Peptoniphilus sp.]|nr:RluA family pseudouridine synthase [Peptoniphilus sp.]MDY3119027.1 RluA family pseudouridine synthase [Peptoniphilus sp.]
MKSIEAMKFQVERNYKRADTFLRHEGFSGGLCRRVFLAGLVSRGGRAIHKHTPLEEGDAVAVAFGDEETDLAPEPFHQRIVYEDEDLMVIDKGIIPSMPCKMYPCATLANEIAGYFQSIGLKRKVRMLGRLDKETTGLLMVAKNPYAYGVLEKNHTENKTYLALVLGAVTEPGIVDAPIGPGENSLVRVLREDGQRAVTRYRPLVTGKISLLEITLKTGRTHQIRCHLHAVGHPVLGDELYGGGKGHVHLHVHRLSFIHPRTKEAVTCVSPMPDAWRDDMEG